MSAMFLTLLGLVFAQKYKNQIQLKSFKVTRKQEKHELWRHDIQGKK